MTDEEEFRNIVGENYEYVEALHPSVAAVNAAYVREQGEIVKREATAIDGIVTLLLIGATLGLLVWSSFGFGWSNVRMLGGIVSFAVLLGFVKDFKKGK
jgi:hypothetical protein